MGVTFPGRENESKGGLGTLCDFGDEIRDLSMPFLFRRRLERAIGGLESPHPREIMGGIYGKRQIRAYATAKCPMNTTAPRAKLFEYFALLIHKCFLNNFNNNFFDIYPYSSNVPATRYNIEKSAKSC